MLFAKILCGVKIHVVTSVELSASLDTTFLLIAAVFFLLSYIFQYGAELQKLSDETL